MKPNSCLTISDDACAHFEQRSDIDFYSAFFPNFSDECCLQLFAETHEPAGHTPLSPCRIRSSPDEKYFTVSTHNDSAYGDQGMFRILSFQNKSDTLRFTEEMKKGSDDRSLVWIRQMAFGVVMIMGRFRKGLYGSLCYYRKRVRCPLRLPLCFFEQIEETVQVFLE